MGGRGVVGVLIIVTLIQDFHPLSTGHGIISVLSTHPPCYCGYLLKKEVNWMKSQHVLSLQRDELCVIRNANCKHAGAARERVCSVIFVCLHA